MIAQRPIGAAPVVQGRAEALPFSDYSFDAVLGILTVHHWKDQAMGLSECARVALTKVVLLTNDFDVCANFWLFDYFPELLRPSAYLDPIVRRNISTFSKIGNVDSQLARLESDIASGAWDKRYRTLSGLEALDLGYRILISPSPRR
jgi:ubiquinone/menaquinone biosynthesis C-methylase UbiE